MIIAEEAEACPREEKSVDLVNNNSNNVRSK